MPTPVYDQINEYIFVVMWIFGRNVPGKSNLLACVVSVH
eukprot:SAG11_NODE_1983_length_3964_cov_5.135023_3_plen_39_part_00